MNIAKVIEYTNLNPSLRSKEIKKFVKTAVKRGYRSVVLTYNNLLVARQFIQSNNYDLKIVTVFGFPFDRYNPGILDSYKNLYDDIDILIPINLYYYNNPPFMNHIERLLKTAREKLPNKTIKFIIETTLMRDKNKQIKELCRLAKRCKVDVIKTCSGLIRNPFRRFEDLEEEIKIIKKYWRGPIKASGGIRTKEEVEKLVKLGVKLIGTSTDILK